jgi:hypothetical protein
MNKWIKLVLGILIFLAVVVLILPSMPLESWGRATIDLIKGGLALLIMLIGISLIIIGITELKE